MCVVFIRRQMLTSIVNSKVEGGQGIWFISVLNLPVKLTESWNHNVTKRNIITLFYVSQNTILRYLKGASIHLHPRKLISVPYRLTNKIPPLSPPPCPILFCLFGWMHFISSTQKLWYIGSGRSSCMYCVSLSDWCTHGYQHSIYHQQWQSPWNASVYVDQRYPRGNMKILCLCWEIPFCVCVCVCVLGGGGWVFESRLPLIETWMFF